MAGYGKKIKSGKVSGYTNKMPKKKTEVKVSNNQSDAGGGGEVPCALKYNTTAKGYKGFKP